MFRVPMRLSEFEQAALGEVQPANSQLVPEISAPVQQISYQFTYQSYFDSTLLQTAVLSQPKNNPIVNPQFMSMSGYTLALHPSSETPIAVTFTTNAQGGGSQPYFLKPGESVTPGDNSFSGFTWGLPFGWLGGGVATILVFPNKMGQIKWNTDAEVIFHRARFKIYQPNELTAGTTTNAPKNWPMRFPWANAFSSTVNQNGSPTAAIVRPTKVLMVLRGFTTLVAAADMRIVFQGTNDFGLDSTNTVDLTNIAYQDFTWPNFVSFGTSGNLASQNPMLINEQAISRLGADSGGIVCIDIGGAAALSGGYVDIVRYGKL